MNDIKMHKRQQHQVTPTSVLNEPLEEIKEDRKEENNVGRKEEKKKDIIERKRVSFDLRIDLHKKLKMAALLKEKHIYTLIEEAIDHYLNE